MDISPGRATVFSLIAAAERVERRLDGQLSNIKGISFSEYRLLDALAAVEGGTTRVSLASAVGLTPSGVTRALKPLEKLGFVETVRDERDARRSLARLTSSGAELHRDADGVVNDSIDDMQLAERMPANGRDHVAEFLRRMTT